tara:strand:+ start:1093 stop:1488 length:396 start_codon:yes stop_codon:yes gene_type:complete
MTRKHELSAKDWEVSQVVGGYCSTKGYDSEKYLIRGLNIEYEEEDDDRVIARIEPVGWPKGSYLRVTLRKRVKTWTPTNPCDLVWMGTVITIYAPITPDGGWVTSTEDIRWISPDSPGRGGAIPGYSFYSP